MSDAALIPSTSYRAIVHTEESGGYWAEVPELPGCYTQGDSLDAIYRNLQEAIACHLDKEISQIRINVLELAA